MEFETCSSVTASTRRRTPVVIGRRTRVAAGRATALVIATTNFRDDGVGVLNQRLQCTRQEPASGRAFDSRRRRHAPLRIYRRRPSQLLLPCHCIAASGPVFGHFAVVFQEATMRFFPLGGATAGVVFALASTASRHVAARVLAPFAEALGAALGTQRAIAAPAVCTRRSGAYR